MTLVIDTRKVNCCRYVEVRKANFQWFQYEFWRFVFVQQEVGKLAMTALEYPPMQKGASFNL